MKKTLMTHVGATLGAAAMVMGLLVMAAPEAEPRSGVGNDRTGMTQSNMGMMSTDNVPTWQPNDDIQPAAGPVEESPFMTHNVYPNSSSAKVSSGDEIYQDL